MAGFENRSSLVCRRMDDNKVKSHQLAQVY